MGIGYRWHWYVTIPYHDHNQYRISLKILPAIFFIQLLDVRFFLLY